MVMNTGRRLPRNTAWKSDRLPEEANARIGCAEVSVEGVIRKVPCAKINGRAVIVTGKRLKVASIRDEEWLDGDILPTPEEFIGELLRQKALGADLFTFSQKLTDVTPHFPFYHEWDSVAVIPIVSFSDWWNKRVSSFLRKDVRKAAKLGVVVRPFSLTNQHVRAIVSIYDETPIRQGRPFWHYGKGFEAVKLDNATYLDRSEFLGAFLGDEMIGFLKIVYVDRVARLMQILAKDAHRDKRPINALLAKAVELCETKGCSHLIYGKYRYSRGPDSSLTQFKHRNGFQEIWVPKYYLALTLKGKLALRLHLHHGAKALVPPAMRRLLKNFREFIYSRERVVRNLG